MDFYPSTRVDNAMFMCTVYARLIARVQCILKMHGAYPIRIRILCPSTLRANVALALEYAFPSAQFAYVDAPRVTCSAGAEL